MNIQLSEHFTYKKLIRFTIPTIIMLIFTSIYGVVDGFFVSNYIGKEAFAGVNLIWPAIMILGAVGFMFGTGGSALVSKTIGQGEDENAIRLYSISYIISGFNIFASSFFTALNNGLVSAIISFLRTLVFQIVMIFLLPKILGINGIWLAVVFAEILSFCVSILFLIINRKKYKYI